MTVPVQGDASPGFERVVEAFAHVFDDPQELGAAFAVRRHGEPVVDVWAGLADRATGRPWQSDTAAVIFSGTKGITALCMLLLWDRGLLDDTAPVVRYWPEFAAGGKDAITVRHILGHTAGIPGLRVPYTFEQLIDADQFASLVAAERAFWPPGTHCAYHMKTFGTICAELIRRVDGRPIGQFVAEEFAEPLGLDLWLGLPPEIDHRLAVLEMAEPWVELEPPELSPEDRILFEAMSYDPPSPPGTVNWNRTDAHRSQVASSGAVATARSMARLYDLLACDGTVDGTRYLSRAAVRRSLRPMRRARAWPWDDFEMVFGPGFFIDQPPLHDWPSLRSVGHPGKGGSVHGAWPVLGVSFSFTMNRLLPGDLFARATPLLEAIASTTVALPARA